VKLKFPSFSVTLSSLMLPVKKLSTFHNSTPLANGKRRAMVVRRRTLIVDIRRREDGRF